MCQINTNKAGPGLPFLYANACTHHIVGAVREGHGAGLKDGRRNSNHGQSVGTALAPQHAASPAPNLAAAPHLINVQPQNLILLHPRRLVMPQPTSS